MAAIIDKHAEAAEIEGPKIIFAGGSNLAFGLDSKKIEQKFGLPVINMALHANLGLTFILNELKDVTKQDDIVFLSIEYFMPMEGNYDLLENARHFYPECGNYYKRSYLKEAKDYLNETENDFKKLFSANGGPQKEDSIYSRKSFNKNGDLTLYLSMKNMKILDSRENFITPAWNGIEKLNQFYAYSKSKHFLVFFLYPPYAHSQFSRNYQIIEEFQTNMKENLKIPILNTPDDFAFNDSLFFNTIYHLNSEGREKRTQRLIEIFSKNLNLEKDFRYMLSKSEEVIKEDNTVTSKIDNIK